MNHHMIVHSSMAVIAAAGIGIGAAPHGSGSGSSGSGNASSARYYREGYRYARANISQSQYQILSHSGYAKWCASTSTILKMSKKVHGRAYSTAAHQWVKGCNAYAAGDGLPANASSAPAPPAAQSPPPTQAPTQAPSSPPNSNPQPSQPAPSPSQPPPYCDPSKGQCQQAPAPPPGGYPGGSQNPCNGPDASQLGDCVPGGGTNGGSGG